MVSLNSPHFILFLENSCILPTNRNALDNCMEEALDYLKMLSMIPQHSLSYPLTPLIASFCLRLILGCDFVSLNFLLFEAKLDVLGRH